MERVPLGLFQTDFSHRIWQVIGIMGTEPNNKKKGFATMKLTLQLLSVKFIFDVDMSTAYFILLQKNLSLTLMIGNWCIHWCYKVQVKL